MNKVTRGVMLTDFHRKIFPLKTIHRIITAYSIYWLPAPKLKISDRSLLLQLGIHTTTQGSKRTWECCLFQSKYDRGRFLAPAAPWAPYRGRGQWMTLHWYLVTGSCIQQVSTSPVEMELCAVDRSYWCPATETEIDCVTVKISIRCNQKVSLAPAHSDNCLSGGMLKLLHAEIYSWTIFGCQETYYY